MTELKTLLAEATNNRQGGLLYFPADKSTRRAQRNAFPPARQNDRPAAYCAVAIIEGKSVRFHLRNILMPSVCYAVTRNSPFSPPNRRKTDKES